METTGSIGSLTALTITYAILRVPFYDYSFAHTPKPYSHHLQHGLGLPALAVRQLEALDVVLTRCAM